ncbi:MAG: hypothetical protein PHR64_02735 [Candidatus Shapirobacteria bacterium]|nr:hypothetical protein [Candidatus Shapirobacteria bacterium]MDD5074158.1 hypothetical protein [Candidatus Shapirobacteria bacterium]MDD5481838.1 hypothetical protein [Candidatus Shapirobacteria bacterium]
MIEEIDLDNQPSQEINRPEEKTRLGRQRPALLAGKNLPLVLGVVVIISFGVVSGWLLSRVGSSTKEGLQSQVGEGQKPQKGEEFGVQDKDTFSDHAIGEISEGGVNGEGTHHLLREGGPSQTVFLFSSVLSLDDFIGRKVEVWGETFSAEKAGWLMDVGKLKVLD